MRPSGPPDARVMIIGEAPGEEEIRKGVPFVGASGYCLDNMLLDAGLSRSACFVTNVCRQRPPNNDISVWISRNKSAPAGSRDWNNIDGLWLSPAVHEGLQALKLEIARVRPAVIIGLGNLALWAITRKWGITDWRGSQMLVKGLFPDDLQREVIFIPTYHPAAVLRQWSWRHMAVHDLRRATRALSEGVTPPAWTFTIRPSYEEACRVLYNLLEKADAGHVLLSVDIETRAGHIACLGIAWSRLEALCIPFMCVERAEGYWSLEEEANIVLLLTRLLSHPNVGDVGQNFLYDVQYIYRHWHFVPRFLSDTMLAHQTCFPGTPKGLDFLSSLYCDYHLFWKSESKDWHYKLGEDQLWAYNCKDCVITYEVHEAIQATVVSLGLEGPYQRQMELWQAALESMIRGVRVALAHKEALKVEIGEKIAQLNQELAYLIGHPINIKSPKQMKALFYEDLKLPVVRSRSTGADTTNDEALEKLAIKEPLVAPIIDRVRALRSLGVFLGTFINAKVDPVDGRLRSSLNPAGTETFRFSSSKDAFGHGLNFQNIPAGDE
jgi:uracil-DNA glycosylase